MELFTIKLKGNKSNKITYFLLCDFFIPQNICMSFINTHYFLFLIIKLSVIHYLLPIDK